MKTQAALESLKDYYCFRCNKHKKQNLMFKIGKGQICKDCEEKRKNLQHKKSTPRVLEKNKQAYLKGKFLPAS